MTPVIGFTQTISDAEARIENAQSEPHAIRQTLAQGCGLLEGYYRAGGVSKCEYEEGCVYLRRVANQRIALHELRQAAVAAGMADP